MSHPAFIEEEAMALLANGQRPVAGCSVELWARYWELRLVRDQFSLFGIEVESE